MRIGFRLSVLFFEISWLDNKRDCTADTVVSNPSAGKIYIFCVLGLYNKLKGNNQINDIFGFHNTPQPHQNMVVFSTKSIITRFHCLYFQCINPSLQHYYHGSNWRGVEGLTPQFPCSFYCDPQPPNPLVLAVLLTLPVNFSQFEPWLLWYKSDFPWTPNQCYNKVPVYFICEPIINIETLKSEIVKFLLIGRKKQHKQDSFNS